MRHDDGLGRRRLSLLVSGGLVLLLGGLGLVAGHAANVHAREVHRADRLDLQQTLAGLVDQYSQLTAAEVVDALAAQGSWSARPGDPASAARLAALVRETRALDAGAVLTTATGTRLASWTVDGVVPARDDPGWAPLRAAVLRRDGTLPLSGALSAGGSTLLAMGLPVQLQDGTTGLVLGLWDARRSALQQYVSELTYGETGHGYVVDGRGRVLAGPSPAVVGTELPLPQLRARVVPGGADLVDSADDRQPLVTSYAAVGRSGWTALTPQSRAEFEGGLVRSGRLVELAVVALLLIAGTGLVVLHRKREAALELVALRDDLTGLYNRRGWFALAEHELERARRQGTSRVLLFVDLDGLKQVNDVLGHREGDRALVDAARVLTAAACSADLVGRLGGDEFVLLVGEDGCPDGSRQRVVDALAAHNAGSAAGFELRLSIGAEVWFPDETCSLDELVRRADADMYADKAGRPGRHEGLLRLPSPRPAADEPLPTP